MTPISESCTHAKSILETANQEPFAWFDARRESTPVVWDPGFKAWLVLSYELCRHVLIQEDQFRHPYADADATLIEIKGGRRNITVLQGDDHDRMHRYVAQLFSARNIGAYRDGHVRPIADELIDGFIGRGACDLAADFADLLPPRVFMSLFGLDGHDPVLVRRVRALHEVIMKWSGGRQFLGPEVTQEARAASHEINAMLLPLIRARKSEPRDDLVSRLWLEAPGILDDVTEDDMLATCRELYLAGSDTTVHALRNAAWLLLTQPDVRAAVAADRNAALTRFIEETMRILGSVQYRTRIANNDTELGGTAIRRDDLLVVVNAAANRDPQHYPCPARIDLERPTPRDHLGFNTGPRTCAGSALAREELRVAIGAWLDRLEGLRLDPAREAPRLLGLFTRSYQPLHVRFTPR